MTVEEGAHQFWRASLAWKQVPGFVEGRQTGELLDELRTLKQNPKSPQLRQQAQALTDLVVKWKVRRPKVPGKQKVAYPDFKTKKVVHETQAA